MDRTGHPGQDSLHRTDRQDSQGMTARMGQRGHDSRFRTAGEDGQEGQSGQESQDRTFRTTMAGHPLQDSYVRKETSGRLEHDRQDN
jgi:hypothetical protein